MKIASAWLAFSWEVPFAFSFAGGREDRYRRRPSMHPRNMVHYFAHVLEGVCVLVMLWHGSLPSGLLAWSDRLFRAESHRTSYIWLAVWEVCFGDTFRSHIKMI